MLPNRYTPFLMVAVALIVGCGSAAPTAATSPASGSASTVTGTDVLSVARKIVPGPGPDAHPCSNSNIATCPVTARLAARVTQLSQTGPSAPGPMNLWCRCQNPGDVEMTAEVTSTGGTAHVVFGNVIKVDLIMVEQAGVLLVDDHQCTGGGAATSIYATPLVTCT